MPLLRVEKMTHFFGGLRAVHNYDLAIEPGQIRGLIGPNGAGKTTTIRMLCGILNPTSGDAVVGGYNIVTEPNKVKTRIGYMSQRFSLYNDLTVEQNINFFGGVYGLENHVFEERKKWVLSMADLLGKENLLTNSLPGGIKQRLALGTAVIHNPEIVFLDEPTSGVDPISRRNFWELINNLSSEGTTIFVTTHYLEEAEFCNNILLINSGEIIAHGNPAELKSNYIKHKILELECDEPVKAMSILHKQSFIGEVSIFGNNIHVNVNDVTSSAEKIKSLLQDVHSIQVTRIDEITPTLEDVFINLVENEKVAVA